jgi:ribosomal protein L24E
MLSYSLLIVFAVLLMPIKADATCYKPRLLFVLDKSGSMGNIVAGTNPRKTRWVVSRDAIVQSIDKYHTQIGFGLEYFTGSASYPIAVPLPAVPHTRIRISIDSNRPGGGTYFVDAMNTAVRELRRAIYADHDKGIVGRRYALMFITDGRGGSCPTLQVSSLRKFRITRNNLTYTYDIKTYPVGMTGADFRCLQNMATVGGTGTYKADIPSQMEAAFNALIFYSTRETCNGLDDDCDGRVDNIKYTTKPLMQACYNATTGCVWSDQ